MDNLFPPLFSAFCCCTTFIFPHRSISTGGRIKAEKCSQLTTYTYNSASRIACVAGRSHYTRTSSSSSTLLPSFSSPCMTFSPCSFYHVDTCVRGGGSHGKRGEGRSACTNEPDKEKKIARSERGDKFESEATGWIGKNCIAQRVILSPGSKGIQKNPFFHPSQSQRLLRNPRGSIERKTKKIGTI